MVTYMYITAQYRHTVVCSGNSLTVFYVEDTLQGKH